MLRECMIFQHARYNIFKQPKIMTRKSNFSMSRNMLSNIKAGLYRQTSSGSSYCSSTAQEGE
jgi:hypothetical protein